MNNPAGYSQKNKASTKHSFQATEKSLNTRDSNSDFHFNDPNLCNS